MRGGQRLKTGWKSQKEYRMQEITYTYTKKPLLLEASWSLDS